jgi:isoleucyl-tRNA synthetase
LEVLSKLLAPAIPFSAEGLYQSVKSLVGLDSVHLESWPEVKALTADQNSNLNDMAEIRRLVSLGLDARVKANIKVKQPLAKLKIKSQNVKWSATQKERYSELIKDEVNVKDIVWDKDLATETELDLTLTPELKAEGNVRELIRTIQDLRKQAKLNLTDLAILRVKTDSVGQTLIQKFETELKKSTLLKSILFEDLTDGQPVKIDQMDFSLKISR